jgi:AraC family transcriptional regulator of adaptative response/methylated-DNA-[protein]-cysteine methyltransferase
LKGGFIRTVESLQENNTSLSFDNRYIERCTIGFMNESRIPMTEPTISYTITPSRLGRMLVAATAKGICFLALGDRDEPMLAELQKDYPQAVPAGQDSTSARLTGLVCDWLDAMYAGATPARLDEQLLTIPLDARGTPFQHRIWEGLRGIPTGQAVTYTQLATRLGVPSTGVRAVAHACATNPVSILIPCHRVRRRDGGLGGYRWGLERKQALLQAEGAVTLLAM